MSKDFQTIFAEVVGSLRGKLAAHEAEATDHPSKRYYVGYVAACDAILNCVDFAARCRGVRPPLEVLEDEMCCLVQVWEGTENAGDILEDVCNTLGHAHGLTSPELRDLWARIQARVYGTDRDEGGSSVIDLMGALRATTNPEEMP